MIVSFVVSTRLHVLQQCLSRIVCHNTSCVIHCQTLVSLTDSLLEKGEDIKNLANSDKNIFIITIL